MERKAVISFYNTPSGLFPWWDQFPAQISNKLNSEGIDHIVFYRDFTDNSMYSREEQNLATNEDLNSLRWLTKQILPLARQYDQVILHSHSHYPPLKIWLLVYLLKHCQWHITEHRIGTGNTPAFKRLIKILLRKLRLLPKHVIGVSQAVMTRNIQLYGQQNMSWIYNGIDLQKYAKRETAEPRHNQPMRALFIGRMDRSKGIFEIVQAFELLKSTNANVRLTMVGGGSDLPTLQKYCDDHDLNSIIEFEGYQSQVLPYYQSHDFVIVPTQIEEALSLVAVESRAMGLPVIYANKGGLPEVFKDSDSGIMLEHTTPQCIAETVSKLVEDKSLYQKLANQANQGIEKFSIDSMTDQYLTHYLNSFGKF